MMLLFGAITSTLVSCNGDGDEGGDGNGDGTGDGSGGDSTGGGDTSTPISYTVSVKTIGGRALEGVTVYVYADSTLSDIVAFGDTNADGLATINMKRSNSYVAVLSRVPDGYNVEPYYEFTGGSLNIVLKSEVIKEDHVPSRYQLGDIMYDFTVKTSDGKTFTLSEVLSGENAKKAVLINFWYSTCSPCISEFPYLQTVADEYADDVAVICLNTYAPDNEDSVKMFKSAQGLTLDMAKMDPALYQAFGESGYPTNVMIDKYGTVCLVEVGALPSEKPFRAMFEYFSADDYKQKLFNNIDELTPQQKPIYTQPDSATMGGVLSSGDINATYYPEKNTVDAEYAWPFVITEKNGVSCVKASNALVDSSYAIMHADVEMKAGDVLSFEYFSSTELGADFLFVLVEGEDIYSISGVGEDWEKCYPFVADEDGTYTVSFIYVKDSYTDAGDDTIYLKNFAITDIDSIDRETYIPRYCAKQDPTTADYEYVDVVLGDDGYYHVGTKDGPLLLADLMGYTLLSSTDSVYTWAYNGEIVVSGRNYYDAIVTYCSYASNSAVNGMCTVNEELKQLLDVVISVKGFEKDENEWLKLCRYYNAYGTEGKELSDPIAGLAPHSAFDTVVNESAGLDEFPNTVTYDRIIMPRGLWFEFTPETSGVYRIISNSDSAVNGWIFNANREECLVYDHIERISAIEDPDKILNNVSMVMYFEAGTSYYIDIAFYDVEEYGSIDFKVEYVGESLEIFRAASPTGAFTYELDEDGNLTNKLIAGGIDVVLGDDGYYYEKLADGSCGAPIYVDFSFANGLFDKPIYDYSGKGNDLLTLGAFDFSKTEYDLDALYYTGKYTDAELKELWGSDYDSLYEFYQIADVRAGRFHGTGADKTELIRSYLSKVYHGDVNGDLDYYTEDINLRGCVRMTAELAPVLQALMDKYTFKNVTNSWTKLCYYYEYHGPAAAED